MPGCLEKDTLIAKTSKNKQYNYFGNFENFVKIFWQ